MNLKGLSGVGCLSGILGLFVCAASGALKLAGYSVFLQHRSMTWFVIGLGFIQVAILMKLYTSCSSAQKT